MNEVTLFPTCLGEEFFPGAVAAAKTVLERLGLGVNLRPEAFCCGQAAFNEGMRRDATELAARFLAAHKPGTPLVVPSGSCASMLKVFYPDLLAGDPGLLEKARALIPWVHEFSEFLVDVLGVTDVGASFPHSVTYHPSCHLLRELHVTEAPRKLLENVRGLRLCELPRSTECCGFGGLFSVKFPDISAAMLADKCKCIEASGAEFVVANDGGCLMQMGGGLHRANSRIRTRHLAEILASR
jgi:L-lactate dehydrogenase complex protein LldE